MKPIISFTLLIVLAIAVVSCSRTNVSVSNFDWKQELEQKSLQLKSPYVDNPDLVRVYFTFDTIVNDYKVTGIFYPTVDDAKNHDGGVFLLMRNVVTGKEYEWTNYDHKSQTFTSAFISKNICDLIEDSAFSGFKDGDSYVFIYHNEHDTMRWAGYDEPEIFPLKSNAEFQFYDVDFDGRDELLISCYRCDLYRPKAFDVYELTNRGLKKRTMEINSFTRFDKNRNRTSTMAHNGPSQLILHEYESTGRGNLRLKWHTTYQLDGNDIISSDTSYYNCSIDTPVFQFRLEDILDTL